MNQIVGTSINPLIRQKDEQIQKLSKAVELLQYEKLKSTFMDQFMRFLSNNYTYSELLKETAIFFRQEFKSTYAGIFLYDPDQYHFVYQTGTGYKAGLIPVIDESGSIMGETLHNDDMVIVEDTKERYFMVPLNQTPEEYNMICVPIFTKQRTLVLRIANIADKTLFNVLTSIMKNAVTALTRNLDYIHEIRMNNQALRGVSATYSITRMLQKTLDRKEIVHRVFDLVVELMENQVHMIVVKNKSGVTVIEKSEKQFYLGGTPASHTVYLKNLFEAFPDGNAYIPNIHKAPRWSWPDMRYHSINMAPLHSEGKLIGGILSISVDEQFTDMERKLLQITATQTSTTLDRALYFRKQEEFASLDGLTQLLNRRMFDSVLVSETAVANRYNRPLSIVMFDIDFFKKFNDVHGHSTGDEVLQVVAGVIMKTIRDSDRAFRYGGEEFIIICPETSDQNAGLFAERLRKNIENTRTTGNLQVTISLGVTQYKKSDTPTTFSKRVDDLLYVSKENGRNCVSIG